jgi:hypothetical protein
MTWWLRSRRIDALGVALALQLGCLIVFGGSVLAAPSLLPGPAARVPAAILPALILAGVVQHMLESAGGHVERVAVRRVTAIDEALLIGCLTLVAAVGALAAALGAPLAGEATRNAFGLVGLGLIAGRVAGPRAGAIAPAIYVIALALLNTDRPRIAELWQWPLQDAGSPVAAAVALGLAVAGLCALAAPRSRPAL